MFSIENNQTIKAWVDYWPTYLILGASLALLIDKTGALQPVIDKFIKKEGE